MDIFTTVYAHAVALSALSVVALQQILKLKFVPVTFANKYPVPTLITLSVIAAVIAQIQTPVQPQSWTDWVVLTASVAVTAAITYRATIANWTELRATEGNK